MATLKPLIVSIFLLLSITQAYSAVFRIPSGDIPALIAAINAANANGKANTVILEAGTYTLTQADNGTGFDHSGLPVISSRLTIRGAGSWATIIERQANTDGFRLLKVAATGNLTLKGLTLRNGGHAFLAGHSLVDFGGGIYNVGGTVALINCLLTGNRTQLTGAIDNDENGLMTITNSSVVNNEGEHGTGGIDNAGTLMLANTNVNNNRGDYVGGIRNVGRSITIINSTVSNNIGDFDGSGIVNFGATVEINTSTIVGNRTTETRAAGIAQRGGLVTLQNTIVALNTRFIPGTFIPPAPPRSLPADCFGSIISLGTNLIGDPIGCTINLQPTDLTGDPVIGLALVEIGTGTGHLTPQPGSPVIDAGNPETCPVTDQFGLARVGNCDIGASEFQPEPVLRPVVNVRPHSENIDLDPNSTELIRVAILSTNSFDASIVDPASVRFGPNQVAPEGRSHFRDTNGDGLIDMVLRFRVQGSGIQCGDSFVSIRGRTATGVPIQGINTIVSIQGIDTIRTVGCN